MSAVVSAVLSPLNGGLAAPSRDPGNLAASITYTTFDATIAVITFKSTVTPITFKGTATVVANTLGGTLAVATFDSTTVGWTMQQASITLSEFNDLSINLAITQNSSPVNLSGQSLQMLLKTAAGTPDTNAIVLSSTGGSPAIVITNASQGLATVTIPSADVSNEVLNFYRVDLINGSGQKNTCVYGQINWITL